MSEPQEHQRVGLGLPRLALQVVFKYLTPQAKTGLLRSSRSVRHELLMCADAVCFTPKAGGPLSSRSQQLRHVLQQRKEPLKLTLTVISSGSAEVEEMAALLAEVAATSRPVRGDGGAPLCCVEQLIVKGRSAQGWGCLLGAAFPNISHLTMTDSIGLLFGMPLPQLDVQLLSGLPACTSLTHLSLSNVEPTATLTHCTHLLPVWLPHVHTLECHASKGGLSLVQGLSSQLQHIVLSSSTCAPADPADVASALAACQELVTLSLPALSQPVLTALSPLPQLKELDASSLSVVATFGQTAQQQATHHALHTLSISTLEVGQACYLPLSGLQQLLIKQHLFYRLQGNSEMSRSSMWLGCSSLTFIPKVHIPSLHISHKTPFVFQGFGVAGTGGVLSPEQCGPQLEAALSGLQPLAGKLPSLDLSLEWLDSSREDANQGRECQLGPEPLRGLHDALKATLTGTLSIGPPPAATTMSSHGGSGGGSIGEGGYWAPSRAFWETLPEVLPQLSRLVLRHMAPLGVASAAAMAVACARLQREGRVVEIVLERPLMSQGMREVVEVVGVFGPQVVVRVVP